MANSNGGTYMIVYHGSTVAVAEPEIRTGDTDKALSFIKFIGSKEIVEYSCAVTPQIRQTGNRLSGMREPF